MVVSITVIGVLLIACAIFHKHLVYPLFLSPLSQIPTAHWSCSVSSTWLLWKKWNHQENRLIYKRHMESGPVLRIAPNTLSVNCFEDGVKKIYQGGFPKSNYYSIGFANYGKDNIFTFQDNETHSARKRIISNTFSKSHIMSSSAVHATTQNVLLGRYLPLVCQAAVAHQPVEVLELNYAYSMDAFTQWQFGKSRGSNFVQNHDERKTYLESWFKVSESLFWLLYLPNLARILRKIGIYLVPKHVDTCFSELEAWNLKKCDQAQQALADTKELASDEHPAIFAQAMKVMSNINSSPRSYPQRFEIASEMFTHNSAAFETSGITLTYFMYEMCRNPQWQRVLREELLSLEPQFRFELDNTVSIDGLPRANDIDCLPVLHALMMETLRLYPSMPGGQPRVVPAPCTLGKYDNIPTGTVVQSYAFVLHRTPCVFPEPQKWKPERWLESTDEQLAIMRKWFWAFSSGGRMCIGSHFAYYSMKFLIAAIYTNFTTLIHDQGDMAPLDFIIAGPTGGRLELKFHPVEELESKDHRSESSTD